MTIEFAKAWRAHYGATDPASWLLRARCQPRWLRIYALPDGKRYPETADEIEEIHRRHDAIAAELFPDAAGACWLVAHDWDDPDQLRKQFPELPGLELTLGWQGERHEDGVEVRAWVARTTWSADATRAAREAVMRGQRRLLWVSCATMEVFAPYDGGIDLIAAGEARRDDLADRFDGWRSPRPQALAASG